MERRIIYLKNQEKSVNMFDSDVMKRYFIRTNVEKRGI